MRRGEDREEDRKEGLGTLAVGGRMARGRKGEEGKGVSGVG